MDYTITKLTKNDYEEWDNFVKTHKGGTIFHTLGWKKVLEESYGYEPRYYVIKNANGEITGIFPTFKVKTFFGKIIVSQPFAEYGGALVREGYEKAVIDILNIFKKEVKNGVKYIEIRKPPFGMRISNTIGYKKEMKAYNFYLNLENKDFKKDIWNGVIHKKVRTAIRKAIKSGVIIEKKMDMDLYYDLYIKTMARMGSPPHSKKFLKNIERYLKDYVVCNFAYLDGIPIAALLSFRYKDIVSIFGNVSDSKYWNYNANDLLYCSEIKEVLKLGYKFVEFGRTNPNSQYVKFKKRHGGENQVELYSYIYPQSKAGDINPYRFMTISNILQNVPWLITKTGFGVWIKKMFP